MKDETLFLLRLLLESFKVRVRPKLTNSFLAESTQGKTTRHYEYFSFSRFNIYWREDEIQRREQSSRSEALLTEKYSLKGGSNVANVGNANPDNGLNVNNWNRDNGHDNVFAAPLVVSGRSLS